VKCQECGKDVGESNWQSCKVIQADVGSYFQGPKRTWQLEAPGVKAFMVDKAMYCSACFQQLQEQPAEG